MPTPIDRDQVQHLLEQGAQLIEVLPQDEDGDEYEDEHLPGAINIPLKTLDRETTRQLDRDRHAHLSPRKNAQLRSEVRDMHTRAHWRLGRR